MLNVSPKSVLTLSIALIINVTTTLPRTALPDAIKIIRRYTQAPISVEYINQALPEDVYWAKIIDTTKKQLNHAKLLLAPHFFQLTPSSQHGLLVTEALYYNMLSNLQSTKLSSQCLNMAKRCHQQVHPNHFETKDLTTMTSLDDTLLLFEANLRKIEKLSCPTCLRIEQLAISAKFNPQMAALFDWENIYQQRINQTMSAPIYCCAHQLNATTELQDALKHRDASLVNRLDNHGSILDRMQ